jgi:peptidoglycan/xylan/chitin deacetylase (PgdA/CDA1 family)
MDASSPSIRRSILAWHAVRERLPADPGFDLAPDLVRIIDRELRIRCSRKETWSRLAATDLLNALPAGLYRPVTTFLKRLRGRNRLAPTPAFTPGAYADLLEQSLPATTSGRLTVCLTHDIDTARCAEFWPKVIAAERAVGVKSASNVLVNGPYTLDPGWLNDLSSDGFEIGLHGDSHDMAIGYRNPARIRERLRRCLDRLDQPVVGYRAPAFAISEPLLAILADLGFRYDSSVKANLFYRGGLNLCAPYLYPGIDIWEMPLSLQDDGLFRDAGMNEDQALRVTFETMRLCAVHDGLFVLNTHPVGLSEHPAYYERFLKAVAADSACRIVPPRELAARLDAAAPASSPVISEAERCC